MPGHLENPLVDPISFAGYSAPRINGDAIVSEHLAHGNFSRNYPWGFFEGHFVHGKAHGFGVQTMPPAIQGASASKSSEYRGDWRFGKRDGFGRLEVRLDNESYEGGWKDGKAFGHGKLIIRPNMDSVAHVESGFKDGLLHGFVATRLLKPTENNGTEGAVFRGGMKSGVPHGWQSTWIGLSTEIVSFDNGTMNGFVIKLFNNVLQSKDFWLNGSQRAAPTVQFRPIWLPYALTFTPVNARYNGVTHSPNTRLDLTNGDTYDGSLQYGLPHGYGLLRISVSRQLTNLSTQPRGTYDGGWKEGAASGYGIWMGLDGNSYEGGWKDGKPYGYGTAKIGFGETVETFWDDETGWRFDLPPPPPLPPVHVDPYHMPPSVYLL
jgi:hypothetical protein